MTDTMCELILRVFDYVERTPGAHFEIWRHEKGVLSEAYHNMLFLIAVNGENHCYSNN